MWKVSKYGVFSGPNFLVFELNIEIYLVNIRVQSKYKRYGVEQTPFLDTLHAVWPVGSRNCWINRISGNDRSKRKYNFLVITTFLVSIAVTDSHAFERFWEKKETEKKKQAMAKHRPQFNHRIDEKETLQIPISSSSELAEWPF